MQTQAAHEYVPPPAGAVFGRPLKESLKYANVQISTADANGKLYVWGYIPVVVAKWCVITFPSLHTPLFCLLFLSDSLRADVVRRRRLQWFVLEGEW